MYTPKPIDTKDVLLPKEIMELSEVLSRNTHEVWASERMKQGWRYGEKRDDELKLHPCLVEYDELSEIEKDYDRNTAMETLKLIVKMGYEIRRK